MIKQKPQRKFSLISLLLALLLTLTVFGANPVGAEGVKALDLASYSELASVDDELITKFMKVNLKPGASLAGTFNFDFEYDLQTESFPSQQIILRGDMKFVSTDNYNAMLNLDLMTDFSEEKGDFKYDLYLVNHDESPEHFVIIVYTSAGPESDADSVSVMTETIPRSDIEAMKLTDMTIDDLKSFVTFKVIADHGDDVDIVALLSIEDFNAFLARMTNIEIEGDVIETFDRDAANEVLSRMGEEFSIETFVLPIYMTLEKETGRVKSAKFQSEGIQEIIDRSYELDTPSKEESIGEVYTIKITLNDLSWEITDVDYDEVDRIVIPQHVLEALEATRISE